MARIWAPFLPAWPAFTGIALSAAKESMGYSGTLMLTRYWMPFFGLSQKLGCVWLLPLRLSRTELATSRSVRPI